MHVAIIMDGNGRWARARGRPRAAGHVAGAAAVRRTVEAAPGLGVGTLTLYAFSSDNWRRPPAEVGHLMSLFSRKLRIEAPRLVENGVRLHVIGRRDRLRPSLRRRIEAIEERTRSGTALDLRLAIDYSARDTLMQAAGHLSGGAPLSRAVFGRAVAAAMHAPPESPDVDLLIRTAGEQRLSDFLLWEAAYAELLFTDVQWPDFDAGHLADALTRFGRRERRFGGLAPMPTATHTPITAPARRTAT
ncbi:MAG: di-trans,poly-cis-decaprenylcistransferase [Gemmatimonadetes bacterium]|nr:di-trans,poly-cis-decaprenylcistransferase [Gemmatimonadota bacterium]